MLIGIYLTTYTKTSYYLMYYIIVHESKKKKPFKQPICLKVED